MEVAPIVRRLAEAGLPFEDINRVSAAPGSVYAARAPIPVHTVAPRIVVKGWVAAQQRVGRLNQILRIYLPGDLLEDVSGDMPLAKLVALTRTEIVHVPAPIGGTETFAALVKADTQAKSQQIVQHVIRLGRMNAVERMAHFLLEIDTRLGAIYRDAISNPGFELKQTDIADYLSLSAVHVNRTLKTFRRDGLIEMKTRLRILSYERLKAARDGLGLPDAPDRVA